MSGDIDEVVYDVCVKDSWHGRCCCTCCYHLEDTHHCTTAWSMRKIKGGCVCGVHKGWICVMPETGKAHSGWTEHGLCEMHHFKKDM